MEPLNEGEYGIGLVRNTSFGRKRVALSDVCLEFRDFEDDRCPQHSKRLRLKDSNFLQEKPSLADMPLEILIRIVCGTDHDDLKSLLFVSKAFKEAVITANESHFTYTTPRKTIPRPDVANLSDPCEIEAPNAPKRSKKARLRLSAKKLVEISVALFASEESRARKRCMFSEM